MQNNKCSPTIKNKHDKLLLYPTNGLWLKPGSTCIINQCAKQNVENLIFGILMLSRLLTCHRSSRANSEYHHFSTKKTCMYLIEALFHVKKL